MTATTRTAPLRVLIADDSEADMTVLGRLVRKHLGDVEIFEVDGGSAAIEMLTQRPIDVALVDYRLPDIDGLEVLDRVSRLDQPAAMILMTGQGSERIAAQSIQRGARDYLVKQDLAGEHLERAITQAVTHARIDAEHASHVRRLEQSHRELGQLVRSLSHDMTANFMVLENCFQQVKSSFHDRPAPALTAGVSHVEACLEESKRFLADLSMLGSTGSIDMQPQRLDLLQVIHAVLYELDPLLIERNVRVEVDPDLPAVRCNETRLRQVFSNLLRNAIKHGCDPAAPRISIGRAEGRREAAEGSFVWLHVADNGPGIPAENREDVFLPGRRLNPTQSAGTGLGLPIVQKTIEHYGGSIHIESPTSGCGAVFVLSLPRDPA